MDRSSTTYFIHSTWQATLAELVELKVFHTQPTVTAIFTQCRGDPRVSTGGVEEHFPHIRSQRTGGCGALRYCRMQPRREQYAHCGTRKNTSYPDGQADRFSKSRRRRNGHHRSPLEFLMGKITWNHHLRELYCSRELSVRSIRGPILKSGFFSVGRKNAR